MINSRPLALILVVAAGCGSQQDARLRGRWENTNTSQPGYGSIELRSDGELRLEYQFGATLGSIPAMRWEQSSANSIRVWNTSIPELSLVWEYRIDGDQMELTERPSGKGEVAEQPMIYRMRRVVTPESTTP